MKYLCILLLIILLNSTKRKIVNLYNESSYFTSWATGMNLTGKPKINLNENSIRQIIRVSAGGEKIRLKFSNLIGNSELEIKKVCIADLISKSKINKKTLKYLTFNGEYSITINKEKEEYSDTINYILKPFSLIAITIYFGKVPTELSGHSYSLTYSYIEKGNKITKKKFSERNKVDHLFFISALEISSESPKKVIVFFGDSITDGVIFKDDMRDNYPDIFFEKLYYTKNISDISVVNEGINADRLLEKGLKRYKHDVLNIKGVSYIIVLYGVNDINALNATSYQIISGYKKIIEEAHKRHIYIYAGTIMPFSTYKAKNIWNKEKEKERQKVNKWIRETKPENSGFDAFFDFDKNVKDSENETK